MYSILYQVSEAIRNHFTLIKPEAVLKWAHKLIKSFWTYPSKKRQGRPGTPFEIKQLVLEIKNINIFRGNGRIQGELLKLGISLDKRTIDDSTTKR